MKRLLGLLLLAPMAGAQVLTGPLYNQTDVISTNAIALTNKTIDCTLNTCLNTGGAFAANTFYVKCVGVAATDTAALAAAATSATSAGGTIIVTGNCSVNNSTTLPSNTTVNGYAATITPVAHASWAGGVNGSTFVLAANATNIKILGFNFAYPSSYTGACHIIELYSTNSTVLIKDNTGNNCGNMVSNIGATDVTIDHNFYTNALTSGFGTWNGATGVKVTNNFISVAGVGSYGIEFTGETTGLTAATSTDMVETGNTIFLLGTAEVGINIDGLTSNCTGNSAQNYGTIADNHIFTNPGVAGYGILLRFCATWWDVHDNEIFSDSTDMQTPAIAAYTPDIDVKIHDNIVYNWNNQNAGSVRGLFANSSVGGTLTFNECYSCTSASGLIGVTDSTTQQFGNDTGSGAFSSGSIDLLADAQIDWIGRGIITSPSAAAVQLGAANSATPVNQSLLTQSARTGTDTNTAGANLIIASGRGTGAATGSSMELVTPNPTGSGTGSQAFLDGLKITAPAISIGNTTSNPTVTFLGSGAISGTPITNLFASPPAIGGTSAAAGTFTTLGATGLLSPQAGITATGGVINLNASSNNAVNIGTGTTTSTVTLGQNSASPGAVSILGPVSFGAGTAFTGGSWLNVSPVWNGLAMTLNDTTASGTVASDAAYSLQAPTFTSTGGASTTITTPTVLYIAAPVCSGGVVCSTPVAINTPARIQTTGGLTALGASINFNASSNNTTNINTGSSTGAIHIGDGSGNNTIGIGNGTGVVTFASPVTMSNATVKLTGVTTGTNADTVCKAADGTILIQAAACTISSLRFKENVADVTDSTIPEIANMRVASFRMKDGKSNADPNAASQQVGLIAENIATVAPECAIYESDMKTPKSYRQECVIALLVKGEQELVKQNAMLKARIEQLEAH